MNSAAAPLLSISVGVVVERRKADSPWIDFVWRAIGVLPDVPDMPPWSSLHYDSECKTFYAGGATIDLYRSETEHYRDNLLSEVPCVWVVLANGLMPLRRSLPIRPKARVSRRLRTI